MNALNLQGCEASGSLNINVFPAPISAFEISELLCSIPSIIYLTNNSYGGQTYSWELNNQQVSSELEPVFEATQIGLQQVDLLVTNSFSVSQSTEFVEVCENPIPQVIITPQEGCEPLELIVEDISLGAISTNITIANSEWFVYNGGVPDQISIENSGNYVLSMVAISPDGCITNMSDPEIINVWPLPDTDFNAEPLIVSSEDQLNPIPITQLLNL